MLKLALIENLRRLAEETLEGRASRLEADRYLDQIVDAGTAGPLPRVLQTAYVVRLLQRMREYGPLVSPVRAAVEQRLATQAMTAEDAIRTEHQSQAMGQVSVGNAITSLRFCAALDWTLFFEQVSLVEQVLQRDPAAVYGSMDFQSRDRYRQAVEELAEPSGEAQLRVALRSVESAREVAERKTAEDRAAHVGYHLIGRGRRDLETDVSYQPTAGERVYRFLVAHATAFYLGSIALITALLLAGAAAYVRRAGGDCSFDLRPAILGSQVDVQPVLAGPLLRHLEEHEHRLQRCRSRTADRGEVLAGLRIDVPAEDLGPERRQPLCVGRIEDDVFDGD